MRKSRASFFASAFSFFVFFLAPSQVLSMSCEGSLTAAELRKMLLEISSAPSEARPALERTFTERLSEFRRKFLSNLKGLSPDQQDRQWQRFLEDLQTIAPLFRLSPKPLLPVLPIKTPLLEDVIKEISIGRSSKEDGKETALILLSDGKAKCWDESHSAILFDCQAPAISGDVHPQDVVKILKTRGAFSALKKDGSVVCWGDAKECKGIEKAGELKSIASTFSNFLGIRKDGSFVCWGAHCEDFAAPDLKNGEAVFATQHCALVLKKDGTAVNVGGLFTVPSELRNIAAVYTSLETTALLKTDGHMIFAGFWKPSPELAAEFHDIRFVLPYDRGFLAQRKDGTLVSFTETDKKFEEELLEFAEKALFHASLQNGQ